MTKWSDIKAAGLHLALNRDTYYCNSFPYNCLYYTLADGFGCDCIGLLKGLVNNPNQAYTTIDQSYVQPGLVIPDWTENQLINACPDKSSDFSHIEEGEILMTCIDGTGEEYGHGAWFVGEFEDPHYHCIVNTIECTTFQEYDGIITTYTDENGYHYTSKGGRLIGKWEYHGHLYDYVDYDIKKVTLCVEPEIIEVEEIMEDEKLNPSKDDWYYEDCEWAKKNGIMTGYSDGNMYPDKNLTRGEACALMHRLYNLIKAD